MSSVFTKIINGELPSYKILETDSIFAFLALDQINLGHTLVVPKKFDDHFFDVADPAYTEIFLTAKKISKAIKKVTDAKRICLAIQGFEVNHCHIHLIPANSPADFNFKLGRQREPNDMLSIQNKIMEAL